MSEIDFKAILKANEFRFNKQFGQNFLTDTNLLNAIVSDADITSDDTVIEIGAGAGTLTYALSRVAKRVIAYEIDHNLEQILNATVGDIDNVEVRIQDIMKVSNEELDAVACGSYKVVANLPYYITTPLIMRFIEHGFNCKSVTIMVQEEVAARLTALPNTPDYGAITASVASRADVTLTRKVGKQLFFPVPKVDSAVIRIDINRDKYPEMTAQTLGLIKCAFLMRRKTIVNNIINFYPISRVDAEAALTECGMDTRIRGEVLGVEDFIRLSNALFRK